MFLLDPMTYRKRKHSEEENITISSVIKLPQMYDRAMHIKFHHSYL